MPLWSLYELAIGNICFPFSIYLCFLFYAFIDSYIFVNYDYLLTRVHIFNKRSLALQYQIESAFHLNTVFHFIYSPKSSQIHFVVFRTFGLKIRIFACFERRKKCMIILWWSITEQWRGRNWFDIGRRHKLICIAFCKEPAKYMQNSRRRRQPGSNPISLQSRLWKPLLTAFSVFLKANKKWIFSPMLLKTTVYLGRFRGINKVENRYELIGTLNKFKA